MRHGLDRGVMCGVVGAPVDAAVVRAPMNGKSRWRPGKILRLTVFLEVEVMVEQHDLEDAADEIAPWEMWP